MDSQFDPVKVAVAYGKPVPLPASLTQRFASRAHRMHHYLWHQTRNSWARYPASTRAELTKLGWAPPRIHQDENGEIVLGNNAGEDFLYMHRQMIRSANAALVAEHKDPHAHIAGWTRLPTPDEMPTPDPFEHPDGFLNMMIARTKTDEYFEKRMQRWEKFYTDYDFLRTVTLGDLGSRVEATVHDAMHIRWCSKNAVGHRKDPGPEGTPGELFTIDKKWDDPAYNFLGDEYSSHTHPLFFRIHGWVDDRISDWMIANGVRIGFHADMPDPVWRGTWEGVLPDAAVDEPEHSHARLLDVGQRAAAFHEGHGDHGHDADYLARLEAAVAVVLKSGCIHHPYSRRLGR